MIVRLVIWDAIAPIMTSPLWCSHWQAATKTRGDRDILAVIFQTTVFGKKTILFWLIFHWILLPRVSYSETVYWIKFYVSYPILVTHMTSDIVVNISLRNGLSLIWRQDNIWTNAGLLSIGLWEPKFSETLTILQTLHWWKCISKYRLQHGGHFIQASMRQHFESQMKWLLYLQTTFWNTSSAIQRYPTYFLYKDCCILL